MYGVECCAQPSAPEFKASNTVRSLSSGSLGLYIYLHSSVNASSGFFVYTSYEGIFSPSSRK